jgi:hypothetical protein
MSANGNEKTSLAGLVSSENTFSGNNADIIAENQPIKPEIDLKSWAKRGGIAKPSRTERKPKHSWNRGGK